MKISKVQFQAFLDVMPAEAWAVIYTELKNPDARLALRKTLFDEAGHARGLTDNRVRAELISLIAQHQEIKDVLLKGAIKYHTKHSWRRWLPWNR